MKNIIITFSIVLLLFSCKKEKKEKVEFKAEIIKTTILKDSTLVEFADLPIRIDSTNYLVHIKGYHKKYNRRNSRLSSYEKEYTDNSYSVARYSGNRISGNITNLKFQHINNQLLIPLTDKKIRINQLFYLKKIFKNNGKQLLLYEVYDIDTNNDGKLNFKDVKSLYISNIDGSNFKKLSLKYFNLIDWSVIEVNNTLYFRTKEDTNKNGEFENDDKIHYQFVDLNDEKLKVTSYNPL